MAGKATLLQEQALDITDWRRDEEFAQYPEGARDKTLVYSPSEPPVSCLPNHHYLFKRSSRRSPDQFWMEIIAYHVGVEMGVSVPPAFAAFDRKTGQSGALIEWFFFPLTGLQTYIAGGDLCQQYLPTFDRKKGKEHNFELVDHIFTDLSQREPTFRANWKEYWAKTFVFDALIANTDRHQDNWGIIKNFAGSEEREPYDIQIAPAFDNGTSMGYNILPDKFKNFNDPRKLEKFFLDGWHHMKWSLEDGRHMGHGELLHKLSRKYRETHVVMLGCLRRINFERLTQILENFVVMDIPVKLSAERAAFVLKLLQFRCERLIQELESCYAIH